MFGKKCPQCGNKIKKDFKFCPSCKFNLTSDNDSTDYGFLGRDDIMEETAPMTLSDKFMDKMLNSAMKMVEKQMRNLNNEMNQPNNKQQNPNQPPQNPVPGLNVEFFVNGEKIFPEGQMKKINQQQNPQNQPTKIKNNISKERLKKFADLPRVEPKTKMKRLSGKIIYELSVPGVKDINDILINQLENSIEIKALSKTKVYSKNLNIKLPILGYGLNGDSLVVEMGGQ